MSINGLNLDINLIVSLVIAVYFLLFIGIHLLKARKKRWAMTLIRLGATVVAAIAAIPVCVVGVKFLADYAYDWLIPQLGQDVYDVLTAIPVGTEGVRALVTLVAAPLLYPIVFLVLHRVLMIIAWILEKCVPGLRPKRQLALSLPLGALNGLLIAVVLIIPLCGLLTMGSHLATTLLSSDGGEPSALQSEIFDGLGMSEEDVLSVVEAVEEHPVVYTVHHTIGSPIFTALTTTKLDTADTHGREIVMNLETELTGLCKTASLALDVADSFGKDTYTAEDKAVLLATADSFFESDWIRMLAADTVALMADTWLKGDAFLGMEAPKMDANIQPAFNTVLTILSTETVDTLEGDIHVILDVFGDFMVYDLFNTDGDYNALVQKLGSSGLLNTTLEKLQANERLVPLVSELKSMSVRLVTNMLGVEDLKNGEYSEMMGNVAGTLTDALDMSKEERDAMIVDTLQNEFAAQGYDVPADVAIGMSDQLMEELGADGEITEEELTDYLVNHSEDLAGALPGGIPDDLPEA